MKLFKSIHKYMCEPLTINSYELFVTTIIALLIHDLWFNLINLKKHIYE